MFIFSEALVWNYLSIKQKSTKEVHADKFHILQTWLIQRIFGMLHYYYNKDILLKIKFVSYK